MATAALSTKTVGSIVKLRVGGVLKDFIVVHQGRPSSLYDTSCNGTWLLMKDIYEMRQWNSSDANSYASSTIRNYLDSTFFALLDTNIQAQVKQVKIPYRSGTGVGTTVTSGLSAKIFLLSSTEVGFNHSFMPVDEGAVLTYFSNCATNAGSSKRIAYQNGSAAFWWLRSPLCGSGNGATYAIRVDTDGYYLRALCSAKAGVRPALILPSSLLVSDSGSITPNTAPTTPASIFVPSSIQGGTSIEVSWSAATDAENNLEGYVVERSTDGGSTWTQIYQGSARSATNTVAFGTETVMYRVRAYDSLGLYSGYRTSAQVTVINNTAPSAPPGITVPETVLGGGSLTVTWSTAIDADGDLTGYELERQTDGGEWVQIYKGPDTSYTDDITRGWSSVNYRVRAYDACNAYSGWTTGTARTVDNNRAPVITSDAVSGTDLGKKDAGFFVSYSVSDEDGDPVTVTEAIDGVELRTFCAGDESNTFAVDGDTFFKLLNGSHVLTIAAGDGQVQTVHRLTFTKEVTEAGVTLREPFAADGKISICVLSVAGDIPSDAEYKVEVTNNANDGAPVWEDCTMEVRSGGNHIFENEAAEKGFAFNFRVSVKRGPSGQGGYINSVQGGFQ